MEVKITVDDNQFKDVLEKELKGLEPETIHDVLIQCIGEYFRQNNYEAIKGLLITNPDRYHWDSGKSATYFTNQIINSCDMSGLQDVVDKCINILKDQYKELLQKVLFEAIVRGLSESYSFNQSVSQTITRILAERNVNQ